MPPIQRRDWDRRDALTPLLAAARPPARRLLLTLKPHLNNISGAPYPRRHRQRLSGTIKGTGATLHAAIKVHNPRLAPLHGHHPMGTHRRTHPTPHTGIRIQRQRHHILKITQRFHNLLLYIYDFKLPNLNDSNSNAHKMTTEPQGRVDFLHTSSRRDSSFHYVTHGGDPGAVNSCNT